MKRTTQFVLAAILATFAVTVAFAGDAGSMPVPNANTNTPAGIKLPRLVDLGADKCVPCKKMAPILAELKSNYVGQLEVEFIDVWKDPDAAKPYRVRLIPTQIFYDANGKELFRHEGFFGKEDILAKWRELGTPLKKPK